MHSTSCIRREKSMALLGWITIAVCATCSTSALADAGESADAPVDRWTQQLQTRATDVGGRDAFGETPLHAAARRFNRSIAEKLLEAGADVDARNHAGQTPLHLLADQGPDADELDAKLVEFAELLITSGADVNAIDNHHATALDYAIRRGHERLAELLRRAGGDQGGVIDLLPLAPTGYPTYAQIESALSAAESTYPDLCRRVYLGDSVLGRAMWALKITDQLDVQEDEPEVKYISTMHGNEVIGAALCLNLIDELLSEYGHDSRITNIVDSVELWIVPCMNPDGYVAGVRENANGIDLNRSFPDPYTSPSNTTIGREPETAHIIDFSFDRNFTLAANFHSGSLLVNYPFDNNATGSSVYTSSPDDDLFVWISEQYSQHNLPMWNNPSFFHGITNGAAWYAISGGMQDWDYVYMGGNEVTIELSNTQGVPWSQVPAYWEDNRESMLAYIETALIGVRGIVTDGYTHAPLAATVRVIGRDHNVFTDPDVGDYHRMLMPGIYDLRFEADGHEPLVVQDVSVEAGPATRLDVELGQPDCQANGVPDDLDIAGGTSLDCNINSQPDECELAPYGNGPDCQLDGVPDECQLIDNDCDENGVPDECQGDCDFDGVPDACDPDVVVLFADDFENDLGWMVQSEPGTTGIWERAEPLETTISATTVVQPGEDNPQGSGTYCYVTDGRGGTAGAFDVDNGPTRLISPPIDLSTAGTVTLHYAYWFYSDMGTFHPDMLTLEVSSDGANDWTVVNTHADSASQWRQASVTLPDQQELTGQMHLRFSVADTNGASFTEALVDDVVLTMPDCANLSIDCNGNGTPDDQEFDHDCNGNGVPDECEGSGDSNLDCMVDAGDMDALIGCLSSSGPGTIAGPECAYVDMDADDDVDLADIQAWAFTAPGPSTACDAHPPCSR